MKKLYEIKNRFTREVIYSKECESMSGCAESAVRENTNLEGANLEGANLRRANLEDANLEGADLLGANLCGANLEGANLRRANLEDANLEGANLLGADLLGANLEGANLRRANLRRANLLGADLCGANLEGANLWGAAGNSREIFTIQREISRKYTINIIVPLKRVQIGCKNYSVDEWLSFNDEEISKMDDGALDWWCVYKPVIIARLEALELMP